MKKIKSKLQLKSQTIRMLQVGEMEQVNGGGATFTCSGAHTGCSSHPPQHTPGSTNNGGGGGGNPGNP